ncbi:MAG: hypothetical protein WC476_00925 [Phycisphaerae bacterium]|jgi:hypothetical protein
MNEEQFPFNNVISEDEALLQLREALNKNWESLTEERKEEVIKNIDNALNLKDKPVEWLEGFFTGGFRTLYYALNSHKLTKFFFTSSTNFYLVIYLLAYCDSLINEKLMRDFEGI